MPAYILRIAGTDKLAGFFAAPSEDHLFDLIDEEIDPSDYEYAIIERGFFDDYDAIVDACCHAWNRFAERPEAVSSITSRQWAQVNL